MVIATPANASTNCVAVTITTGLVDGGTGIQSQVRLSSVVLEGEVCTASVDVTTTSPGTFVNTTGVLSDGAGSPVEYGFATAVLNVPRDFIIKSFTDDPVAPGGTVTLEYTLFNSDRLNDATDIGFDTIDSSWFGLRIERRRSRSAARNPVAVRRT